MATATLYITIVTINFCINTCMFHKLAITVYSVKMVSDSISEHLFFKMFLGGMPPDPPSFSMLRMLIVLRTIFTELSIRNCTKGPHSYNVWLKPGHSALVMTSDSPGNHEGLATPLLMFQETVPHHSRGSLFNKTCRTIRDRDQGF